MARRKLAETVPITKAPLGPTGLTFWARELVRIVGEAFRTHAIAINGIPAFQSGEATLVAGTVTVTLSPIEPNAAYHILLTGDITGETFKWSSKTATTFTITSSNGASTATVDWLLVR
jgi:hypothetical protein